MGWIGSVGGDVRYIFWDCVVFGGVEVDLFFLLVVEVRKFWFECFLIMFYVCVDFCYLVR